jgi:hypothetical protein
MSLWRKIGWCDIDKSKKTLNVAIHLDRNMQTPDWLTDWLTDWQAHWPSYLRVSRAKCYVYYTIQFQYRLLNRRCVTPPQTIHERSAGIMRYNFQDKLQ